MGYSYLTSIPTENIDLIVDGGPENNNAEVEDLLEQLPLTKLIAQVQVTFSNSIIEAANKILKYRYIFRTLIPDANHVEQSVAVAIADYNDRPHSVLFGLTPNQVYTGATFDKAAYHHQIQEAGLHRRAANRHSCPPCVPTTAETNGTVATEVVMP